MSKRVLVCGDADGDLDKLYADVTRQQAQHGAFDFLIATGKFLPSNKAQNASLQAYVTKKKEIPIRTYFIDSESGIFMKSAPDGRKLGEIDLNFLGSYGVKEIDGLRIGYLSGTMDKDKFHEEATLPDGRPKHVDGFYTRSMIDAFKEMAADGPLDLLVTSEWPEGLENSIGDSTVDPQFCSSAVTELCLAFEPRFHIFGLSGQFDRCAHYLPAGGKHVCRPIGLGKVGGPKGKDKKCLHALILVPQNECSAASLMRGEDTATPCPYTSKMGETPGKRRLPAAPAGVRPGKIARTVATPPGFNIRKDGKVTILDIHLGKNRRFSIETGKVFKQAGGAVIIRDGKTQVWGTTCASKSPSDKDFLPLSVEYKERSSAAGKTPGGFIKRDKPMCEDHEILVCRFTDRPLRPLFPDTWNSETQILLFTMGFDGVHPPEPLAICAASASAYISDIPLKRPIAGVMVAMTEGGEYIVNPTVEERKGAKMCVMVAGTTEAVSMIEMTADFVTEEQFLDGVMVGHEAIKVICNGLIAFNKECGKPKRSMDEASVPPQLAMIMDRKYGAKIDLALRSLRDVSATEHEEACSKIEKEAIEELVAKEGVEKPFSFKNKDVVKCFKKMCSLKLMNLIKNTGLRPDGRRPDEVRNIMVEQRYVEDCCHGSSLFTRGDTQTLATCTLGDSGAKQRVESIVDPHKKEFYLQYFFPPSCVGDVKRMTKGRREVGHGNLAERAVMPSIPPQSEFPYTIRAESFITESCGSSSMASVCGASLAMYDSGVPVKCLVSGVAMGMVDVGSGVASDEAIILSDIAELEDFIGKMDFKVAGNETGISAVQLDVKNEGLTRPLFARALEQAKGSRLYILDEMKKHVNVDEVPTLAANVPRILKISIPSDAKGKIIGPGGSNIRKLIAEFNLTNICVDDADHCEISGTDEAVLNTVKMIIEDICQSGPGGRGGVTAGMPKLAITIPAGGKGKLIGRQGSTIKGLIEEFGLADIKISEEGDNVELFGGDEEKREACAKKIEQLYLDGPGGKGPGKGAGKGFSQQQNTTGAQPDGSLQVPRNRLGKVIGRGGATIKGLIEEFGLDDMKARDGGLLEFYGGSEDQRECCMEKIKSMMAEDGGAPPTPVAAYAKMPPTPKAGFRPVMQGGMIPQPPRLQQNQIVRPPSKIMGGGFTPGGIRAPLRTVAPKSGAQGQVSSNAAIVPKMGGAPAQPKVSEDLKMKLQMEFAGMCPGDTKSYRLLPHEVKLAKDLAAAFEMPITQAGNELTVTRPLDEGY